MRSAFPKFHSALLKYWISIIKWWFAWFLMMSFLPVFTVEIWLYYTVIGGPNCRPNCMQHIENLKMTLAYTIRPTNTATNPSLSWPGLRRAGPAASCCGIIGTHSMTEKWHIRVKKVQIWWSNLASKNTKMFRADYSYVRIFPRLHLKKWFVCLVFRNLHALGYPKSVTF
jgi:hypothetical protein